jgi:hypothetical protein
MGFRSKTAQHTLTRVIKVGLTFPMARFRHPNQHSEVAQEDSLPKSRSRMPRGCGNEIPTLGVGQCCHHGAEQIGDRAVGLGGHVERAILPAIDKRICKTKRSSSDDRWWTGRGRLLGAWYSACSRRNKDLDVQSGHLMES